MSDAASVLHTLRREHTTLPSSASAEDVGQALRNKLETERMRHDAISDVSDELDRLLSTSSKEEIQNST